MRKFILDNRPVKCHPVITTGFAKFQVKRGDIVVFRECNMGGAYQLKMGRSMGRIASFEDDGLEDCKGFICLAVPNLMFTHCHILWIDPKDVHEIQESPIDLPDKFFSMLPECSDKYAMEDVLDIEKGLWTEPTKNRGPKCRRNK